VARQLSGGSGAAAARRQGEVGHPHDDVCSAPRKTSWHLQSQPFKFVHPSKATECAAVSRAGHLNGHGLTYDGRGMVARDARCIDRSALNESGPLRSPAGTALRRRSGMCGAMGAQWLQTHCSPGLHCFPFQPTVLLSTCWRPVWWHLPNAPIGKNQLQCCPLLQNKHCLVSHTWKDWGEEEYMHVVSVAGGPGLLVQAVAWQGSVACACMHVCPHVCAGRAGCAMGTAS